MPNYFEFKLLHARNKLAMFGFLINNKFALFFKIITHCLSARYNPINFLGLKGQGSLKPKTRFI